MSGPIVEFRGKEIQNRWARAGLIPVFIVWAGVSVIVAMAIGLVAMCIALVLDPVMKFTGRKGFVHSGPGWSKIIIDREGFRRLSSEEKEASKEIRRCELCGFESGPFRMWVHTYLEWAWWRPFDKRPYHVRNKCVRWLP